MFADFGLLPGVRRWHLGLLVIQFMAFLLQCQFRLYQPACSLVHVKGRWVRFWGQAVMQPFGFLWHSIQWGLLVAIFWWRRAAHALAGRGSNWLHYVKLFCLPVKSCPSANHRVGSAVEDRARRKMVLGKKSMDSFWARTRLWTWITSLKGPVAFRKLRIAKNESPFQLLDLALSFILKFTAIHNFTFRQIIAPGVPKSQRLRDPLTVLKMESQYQDDFAFEWPESISGYPSELDMQMHDGYEDQGHNEQSYDTMAPDHFQTPLAQMPPYPTATDGFTNDLNAFYDSCLPEPGLFPTGLDYYSMDPPNLETISPGLTTVTDFPLSSSSSSSDGYDGSANSPGLFTNALYIPPMTMMPMITPQNFIVAPILVDNNFPMTSNISMASQVLLEQQPYEQATDVTTISSSHQLAEMSLPPDTPSSPQRGNHKTLKKKTKRPTISARERRKKEKPERCPECDRGFAYLADLNKHIVARHEEEAPKYRLSPEKFLCKLCPPSAAKSFTRSDRLKRHERKKHGKARSQGGSLSPQLQSQAVGDGSVALESGRTALKKLCPRGS